LKIITNGNKKVVIVTELYQDNPGTSVTAAGISLAQQICKDKRLNINDILYFECKPNTNSKLSFYNEDYFEVTFTEEFTQPKYRKLSQEEMQYLLL